uniref:EGF-like domain-containing protein n=1 Tax=Poecilia reticulata TaxID=8081 RepID=A0A3P9Q9D5_POERE
AEQMIYWTDVTTQGSMIRRMQMNGTNMEVLHRTSLSNPDGLAVDWVGGNLYWCDKGRDTIEVSKLNGAYRTVLVNSGLREPRAVAVDVRYGYLYWSDWGDNPHIGRIGMDGTDRKIIIEDKITWPNGLTLDFVNDRIYWADAREDYIEFASLDGTSRHTGNGSEMTEMFVAKLGLFRSKRKYKTKTTPGAASPHAGSVTARTTVATRPTSRKKSAVGTEEKPVLQMFLHFFYLLQLMLVNCAAERTCEPYQFRCKNNRCVPGRWQCDYDNDCGDNSDEEKCRKCL